MGKSSTEHSCQICGAKTKKLYTCYRSDGIVSRTNVDNKTVTTYSNVIKLEGAVCDICRRRKWQGDLVTFLILAAMEAAAIAIILLFGENANVLGVCFITAIVLFIAMCPFILHLILGRNGSRVLKEHKMKEYPGVYFTPSEAAGIKVKQQ